MVKSKNTFIVNDKLINQFKLSDNFTSFELKLLFKTIKENKQKINKAEIAKVNKLLVKLNDYPFVDAEIVDSCLKLKIAQEYLKIKKSNDKIVDKYTQLNIRVIEKLKKKKSILLYIFAQKEVKINKSAESKSTNVSKQKVAKFVKYHDLKELDSLVAEINKANNKQSLSYLYDKKSGIFTFSIEKLETPTNKRSLVDDAEKELSKISDDKLEKMFLDIATEIIKRNCGNNGVNAVDMLRDIKNNKEPKPSTYAGAVENINKENDTNKLLIKHSQLEFLIEKIDRKLEFIDSVAYAKAVESENYNEWQAKKEFNSFVPDINQAVTELKKPENETTVQLLMDIEEEVDNNMLNYGTVQFEIDVNPYTLSDFETLEDLKLIKVIRNNNEKVQLLTDTGVKFRRPSNLVSVLEKVVNVPKVMVTEDMLPDFTPDTTEYETLGARAV